MISRKDLFLTHVGQTSEMPLMLEIDRAEGVFIFDKNDKKFLDLNSGISVSSLGHCNPVISEAIAHQANKYMHTMVYGEHIQGPQIAFAKALCSHLPSRLQSLYYLMTGTEATELAIKMTKKYTGKYQIVACRNAYHGSTIGAESLRSDLGYKAAYMPLMPGVKHINFNTSQDLSKIDKSTAAVICEVVQGEAGVITADKDFLFQLRERCNETGALLVFDEIQSGFGRTGKLFAFQHYEVTPDVMLIGKAMGGGMPLAGVVSSQDIMGCLLKKPSLGHITTFGGHPVSCASANAAFQYLLDHKITEQVEMKSRYVISTLSKHPIIREVRGAGLMMAVEPTKKKYVRHIVSHAFELGVLVDWFLFNNRSFRLAPPLVISKEELQEGCSMLLEAFDYAQMQYR